MLHTQTTTFPNQLREGFYTSVVSDCRSWPVRTFLPTGYEPHYPYPLLVFLHGHGGSEEQVLRLAPQLSRRNFVCIGLRGPHQLASSADGQTTYSWGLDGQTEGFIEEYVLRAVEQTRRTFHIHSERVYLAGFCEGASQAYRLGLRMPERFAGVISLNGCMPRWGQPLLRLPEARRLRVLIGHGYANAVVPLPLARRDYQVLFSAGLDVSMRTYPASHRIHPGMLRDVNSWVIEQLNAEHDALRA